MISVTVVSPPDSFHCSETEPIELTSNAGYISNGNTAVVSVNCLWLIRGQPGQRINVTVIDTGPKSTEGHCESVGLIQDIHASKEINICRHTERQKHIYLSTHPKVEIKLTAKSDTFLVFFEGKTLM